MTHLSDQQPLSLLQLHTHLEQQLQEHLSFRSQDLPQCKALIESLNHPNLSFLQREIPDSSLQNAGMKLQAFTQSVDSHIKQILQQIIYVINLLKERASAQQECLIQSREREQGFNDANSILTKQLQKWEKEYEELKVELQEITEKYEFKLTQVKREKTQIKKTFLQVRESTDTLHLENFQINDQLIQQKRQVSILRQQLNNSSRKLSQFETQIEDLEQKINSQSRIISKLQNQLEEKDQTIEKLRGQVTMDTNKTIPSMDLNLGNIQRQEITPFQEMTDRTNRKISFIQRSNLHDEFTHIHLEMDELSKRSFSVRDDPEEEQPFNINQSVRDEKNSTSNSFREENSVYIPDLYYAHFLLTVQAIKLRLGREDLFDVDIRAQYQQMILECRFLQWEQWIMDKLIQARNEKK